MTDTKYWQAVSKNYASAKKLENDLPKEIKDLVAELKAERKRSGSLAGNLLKESRAKVAKIREALDTLKKAQAKAAQVIDSIRASVAMAVNVNAFPQLKRGHGNIGKRGKPCPMGCRGEKDYGRHLQDRIEAGLAFLAGEQAA